MSDNKFSSEGFDLDALKVEEGDGDDVVLEIGGGATVVKNDTEKTKQETDQEGKPNEETSLEDEAIKAAEEFKQQGNQAFKEGDFDLAVLLYTNAIEATPGMTGEQLLKQQDQWKIQQQRKWREDLAKEDALRRQASKSSKDAKETTASSSSSSTSPPPPSSEEQQDDEQQEKPVFPVPPHPHAQNLSIYHCNRAAARLHQCRYQEAVRDCDIAILWNPKYVKALIRRSTAYENMEESKTDLALQDAKDALALEPNNAKIKATVKRLQKIEDERLEKLKEETMGKLKELGNSILGNFGLSLDNFQATQDPKTGSYSINFQQK